MPGNYTKKTDRLNKSYDRLLSAGTTDPYKLLASAIIFQAAADCQNWNPTIEIPMTRGSGDYGRVYCRRARLIQFINSDWIDMLLSWQNEIKPEAVAAELARRLGR